MDKWVLAYTQTLISFVHAEMVAYRLYTVVPRLLKFIDNLTNWYVRFNRKRLKVISGVCITSLLEPGFEGGTIPGYEGGIRSGVREY